MFKIYFVNSAYEKDQVLMYDDTRDDDELKLGNPKLHIEVNAAGTLDFELPSTNVAYSRIIPMVTELHVIKDNQKTHDKHIWFGRALTINTDLDRTKTIHCEGGLAYLNDCIYYDKTVDMGSWSTQKTVGRAMFARYESPTLNESGVHVYGVSPQEASAVIANIMSGGSEYEENLNTPFKHLGRIAKDTDSDVPVYAWVNEPVVPSGDQEDEDYYFDEDNLNSTPQKQCGISNPNNMTAIDLISSMMSNVGGLFWVSKTPHYPKRTFGGADLGDAVYVMQLHMRRHYPAFNSNEGQTIQLGENLTDMTITDDGTTFFTAVHPHGQRVDSGEDFTLDRRGVQNGTTVINKRNWKIDPVHGIMYCPELVEQYGMIIRDLDVGTTNIYEQLVGLGISEIDSIPLISKTVGGSWTSGVRELTVSGIDLSLYNVDYSSIELTDAVRVLAPRHGIDTYPNVTAIDYDLQNVENTVFTLNAIKSSNEITDASPSYGSNSISPSIGSSYVHPKHTEHDLGLYKFSNDGLGHVDSAVAVTKKDITALGIPGEDTNTTYELSKEGSTIKMTGSDGSSSEVEVDGSLNTTYTLTKNGNKITLTGSDGIVYTVNDSNTVYRLTQYADRFNANPKAPKVFLESSMTGNDTEITVPNTRTSTVGQKVLYTEGYGNLQNTDKYASLGDILFTYPDDENGQSVNINAHFRVKYGAFQYYVNVYIYTNDGNHSYTEILVPSALSPPNIRWTVLFTETGTSNGFEKKTRIFRICIDQNSMRRIEYVHGIVHVDYMTGYRGGTLESVKKTDSVDEYLKTFHNEYEMPTNVILSSENASYVAFTGNYNDLSNKPAIPDISGKQDKSTAVTHTANTAVGSVTKPVYVAANGVATPISHSINSDVPANAKFTDTTYSDVTQSAHGLMTAADKKKLDGIDLSKYLPLHGTADKATELTNGSMRYGWCVNNAANADSGYRWFRIGTLALSNRAFDTETMFLHVCSGYGKYGVLCVYTRIDNTGVGVQTIRLSWSNTSSKTLYPKFKLVGIGSSDGVKFELWCYTPSRWESVAYYAIADIKLTGGLLNRWVLEKHSDADAKNVTTEGTKSVTDVDLSYADKAKEAATLTDSGWVNCPLAVTGNTTYPTSASVIRVRKYGKMVKLEGWVMYAKAFNNGHNVATIPDGYRPELNMELIGVPSAGSGTEVYFYVVIGTEGHISFSPADSAGSATFNPAQSYNFQATYFID